MSICSSSQNIDIGIQQGQVYILLENNYCSSKRS